MTKIKSESTIENAEGTFIPENKVERKTRTVGDNTYFVAEVANKPEERAVYVKGTISKIDRAGYLHAFVIKGLNQHRENVEVFFSYNKLPNKLVDLDNELDTIPSKAIVISFKKEYHKEDSTTFEQDNEFLFHSKTGWYNANIFSIDEADSYNDQVRAVEEQPRLKLNSVRSNAVEKMIERAMKIMESPDSYSDKQVETAIQYMNGL